MGKTILITGASSGFGRLTAETLANSGHTVFAGFRSSNGAKKQIADALRDKNVEILTLDVTDQQSVDSAIAQLMKKSPGFRWNRRIRRFSGCYHPEETDL